VQRLIESLGAEDEPLIPGSTDSYYVDRAMVIALAAANAREEKVTSMDLLLGILGCEGGGAIATLERIGTDPAALKRVLLGNLTE
jgi:hypothetical protein